MISLPLDDLYLQWLYKQVDEVREQDAARMHWSLFKQLYTKEFVWLIPNDDNRVEDGRDLRYEFLHEFGIERVDSHWMDLGCSFLEMLIALCRRLSFEADGDVANWFWHLLHTLHLSEYTDDFDLPEQDIDDILDVVIWRTYRRDGHGGLFPLKRPRQDQREVELWYQLNAYLMEND